MTELGSAYVRVRANTAGLKGEVDHGVKHAFSDVKRLIGGAFAAAGSFEFAKHVLEASVDREKELALVKQIVKSTSAAWVEHGEAVDETLVKIAETTGFTVADLSQAFIRIQTGTKNTAKTLEVLHGAMDISRARGMALSGAAVILSRAVQGNVMGLSRMGIVLKKTHPEYDALKRKYDDAAASGQKFTAVQKLEMQRALEAAKARDAETGKLDALAQVQQRFGKATETFGKTAAGQFAIFRENLNDFEVAIGNAVLPALIKLAKALTVILHDVREGTVILRPFAAAIRALVKPLNDAFGGMGKHKLVAEVLHGALGALIVALLAYKAATVGAGAVQAIWTMAMGAGATVAEAEALATAQAAVAQADLAVATAAANLSLATEVAAATGAAEAQAALAVATEASAAAALESAAAQEALLVAETAAAAATPWGLIVVGIAAVAGGLTALYQHNETFRNAVKKTWDYVRDSIRQAVVDITALWDKWGGAITAITGAVFGLLRQTVENGLRTIKGIFQVFHGLLTGDWHEMWAGIKNIVGAYLNQLTLGLRAALPGFKMAAVALGHEIMAGILSPIAGLVTGLVDKLQAVWDGLTGALADAYHWGTTLAGRIIDGAVDWIKSAPGRLKDAVEDWIRGGLSHLNPFSPVEEGGARFIGDPIIAGAIRGITEGTPTLQSKLEQAVRTAVDNTQIGQRIVDSLQTQLDNLDTGPLAQQLAALTAASVKDTSAATLKALNEDLAKAQEALRHFEHDPRDVPKDAASYNASLEQHRQLEKDIKIAEQKLREFQATQQIATGTSVLETQKAAVQVELASAQASEAARQAAETARSAAADATAAFYTASAALSDAIGNVSKAGFDAMRGAMSNLTGIAGSLADTLGKYLDEKLASAVEALGHSKLARSISAMDKQIRERSARDARESARQAITDAKKHLREQNKAVKDAQAELAAILAAGRKKGKMTGGTKGTRGTAGGSLHEDAYGRVVFPDDDVAAGSAGTKGTPGHMTGGETAAEYRKRVEAARKAVADAKAGAVDARQGILDANKSLNDLLFQQKRDRLADELRIEKQHLVDVEAATKKSVARTISDLTERFNLGRITEGQFRKGIKKLVGDDVETYRGIGRSLGVAAADEFWAQLKALGHQAAEIAKGPRLGVGVSGRDPLIQQPANVVKNAIAAVNVAQAARDQAQLEMLTKIYLQEQAYEAARVAREKAAHPAKPKTVNAATGLAHR